MAAVVDIPTSLLFWDCCTLDASSATGTSPAQAFLYLPWMGFVEMASDSLAVAGTSMMIFGFVAMGLRGLLCGGSSGSSIKLMSALVVVLISVCCSVLYSPDAQLYVSSVGGGLVSRVLVGFAEPMDIVKEVAAAHRSAHLYDSKVLPALHEGLSLAENDQDLDQSAPVAINPTPQLLTIPNVFSERELRSVAAKMWKVRNHWKHRLELMPFFTFGLSSYHDSKVTFDSDTSKIISDNNIPIEDQFGFVHERVLKVLTELLQKTDPSTTVTLRRDSFVPGFEIQLSHMGFVLPHFPARSDIADLEASGIKATDDKSMSAFSFTLPIMLPTIGKAGIYEYSPDPNTCVFSNKETGNSFLHRFGTNFKTFCRLFHAYELGALTLRPITMVYQPSPALLMMTQDAMMTLEGRALRMPNGNWEVFW